ncbi:hypothetical protein BZY95_06340 [Billgrantia desiderata SP1]|uniref:type II toxin-antitoxin system HigB family toxin n=1 Tax=Billgrantia desiderata TaxID=52021 RepID=UPI000A3A41E7|nr:hypothetical protein BZY95_06340 [Halomonas desiderata SP1]
MRLIGRGKIAVLEGGHSKASRWLRAWASEVENSNWAAPSDLQSYYPSAVPLDVNTFRFDVGGDAVLDVRFSFERDVACILQLI